MQPPTLASVLTSVSIEHLLPAFESEELTLETLAWMANDYETDFVEAMAELDVTVPDAKHLQQKLRTLSDGAEDAAAPAGPAAALKGEEQPVNEHDAVTALLRRHGLTHTPHQPDSRYGLPIRLLGPALRRGAPSATPAAAAG